MKIHRSFFYLKKCIYVPGLWLLLLLGCGYLQMTSNKRDAQDEVKINPSQILHKKIAPESCTVVYGKISAEKPITVPLLVTAFSFKYGKTELVDCHPLKDTGFYTLSLPRGQYQLYVFADTDNDSLFTNRECVGHYRKSPMLIVEPGKGQPKIISDIHIPVDTDSSWFLEMPLSVAVPAALPRTLSKHFPPGAIRSLDDNIFLPENGMVGLYDPTAFLNIADIYCYALDEHDPKKTPIIFVHGITGTPLDWKYMAEQIDTTRFEAWFFYYPSGEPLDKLADIFYEIFLSGKIVALGRAKIVICAHSMGGLVTRAALNKYSLEKKKNSLKMLFITLCTPYNGHEAAAKGVKRAPVVIPCWNHLVPDCDFLKNLRSVSLPAHTEFHLLFTHKNESTIHLGENSDGTISLKSQLHPEVQSLAKSVFGFDETHTSILRSKKAAERINSIIKGF